MNYLSLYKNELTTIIAMKNHNNCDKSAEKKKKDNDDYEI
jgi:hypothetical protein